MEKKMIKDKTEWMNLFLKFKQVNYNMRKQFFGKK